MFRKGRIRKPVSVDHDHMRALHHEAIEQLEMMRTSLEAAEQASDRVRDSLDDIALAHWHTYMDVMHMICRHDQTMSSAMGRYGLKVRDADMDPGERNWHIQRLLLLMILLALLRHHRRMVYVFGLRGGPMSDYLQETSTMEREHMAELISMIHSML